MSTATPAAMAAAPGREPGPAAMLLLGAIELVTLASFGAVALVLLGLENMRYGRHHVDAEVYPGILRVRTPGSERGRA